MGRSRVALVAVPSVFRVVHRQGRHVLIAVRFGQDARRRDGQESAIPLDFAGVGNVVGAEPISVDEQVLWTEPEAIDGPVHGEIGRLQDVDLLDFLDGGPPDTPRLGVSLDGGPQAGPGIRVELLACLLYTSDAADES